jgi:hypothetical protein
MPLIASPFPNVGEMPVLWAKNRNAHLTGEHKAIVDLDTGKVFCIASNHYKLIRHESAIEQVEDAIAQRGDLGDYTAFTEFYNHGGRMRRTYRFLGIGVEISKDDFVCPELLLFNSYDSEWPFTVLLAAFRVVCTNGLVVEQKLLSLRKRHVYELGEINVQEEVTTALKRFKQQARQWKGWTKRRLSSRAYSRVLESMKFGIKAREQVESAVLREADGFDPDGSPILTLWGFYNVLTWYITHNSISLNHQVEMEGRLRTASLHLMR